VSGARRVLQIVRTRAEAEAEPLLPAGHDVETLVFDDSAPDDVIDAVFAADVVVLS